LILKHTLCHLTTLVGGLGYQRKVQYLVKWKGYSDVDNQWIDASKLTHAQEVLANFQKKNPKAVSHIKGAFKSFIEAHHSYLRTSMTSPANSTISDVVGTTTATTIEELTVSTPITQQELEAVLTQFSDPTQELDEEGIVNSPLTISGNLDRETAISTRALTPYHHIPDTSDISNISPQQPATITFTTCSRCGSTADYCHCNNDNIDSPHQSNSPDPLPLPLRDEVIYCLEPLPANRGQAQAPSYICSIGPHPIPAEPQDEPDSDNGEDDEDSPKFQTFDSETQKLISLLGDGQRLTHVKARELHGAPPLLRRASN
jgi:hypothetical protein